MPRFKFEELSEELIQEAAYVTDTTCPACYAEFLDAEDLIIHVRQVHATVLTPKPCQLCMANYTDLGQYAEHVRDEHLLDLRACKYCSKVFLSGAKLKLHEAGHISVNNLFSCSQCNTLFPNSNLLELHELKNHDNSNDGVFLKCMAHLSDLLCLKVKSLLKRSGKKVFTCIVCEFSSAKLRGYNKHISRKKCRAAVCDLCSSVYKKKKALIIHLQNSKTCIDIDNYKDETTTCADCKKSVHIQALDVHLKTCNALKCIDCDFVCKTVDKLSEHQVEKHPLDMRYTRCKYCSREFIGDRSVKTHIRRVHKPDFPLYKYQCMDCSMIFKHPQKLFAHFFSHHKELTPFTCKICDKSFRVRKSFSLHIKLDHKSVGFVEFDDSYHVFFTKTKSANPFIPKCVIDQEDLEAYKSDSDGNKTDKDITDTDFTNAETEEEKPPKKTKVTKNRKNRKSKNTESLLIYSSDEEPLHEVRKRELKKKKSGRKSKKFICEVCDKNCYTYQNHQNHMNIHKKNQELECVKCSQKFKSNNALTKHMSEDHASSKLTETLKKILEKKQQNTSSNEPKVHKPEPFKVVLRKVKSDPADTPATIKPVEKNLSVKNFIENFTPEIIDQTPKEATPTVSIKQCFGTYQREPIIHITKFKDIPIYEAVPLKMPERFKPFDHYIKTKVTIRLIEEPLEEIVAADHNYMESFQEDEDNYDRNEIPDVAQEVSLEGTEEPPRFQIQQDGPPTKIIIPKMPKGYSKIHIATLQSEAPYFKIIKVDSDNMTEIKKDSFPVPPSNEVINLPDGKKLVTANPLAHLLGDVIPETNNKYKPARDFQGLLAQALLKLEEQPPAKRRRNKRDKDETAEGLQQ